MKQIIVAFLVILIAFNLSCQKENKEFEFNVCIKGKVIGYEACGNGTLIQIEETNFGSTVKYHSYYEGDITYYNVIKSPGIYPEGDIYFVSRVYVPEDDHDLFYPESQPCQALYAPYDVPIIVITSYSLTNCPNSSKTSLL